MKEGDIITRTDFDLSRISPHHWYIHRLYNDDYPEAEIRSDTGPNSWASMWIRLIHLRKVSTA